MAYCAGSSSDNDSTSEGPDPPEVSPPEVPTLALPSKHAPLSGLERGFPTAHGDDNKPQGARPKQQHQPQPETPRLKHPAFGEYHARWATFRGLGALQGDVPNISHLLETLAQSGFFYRGNGVKVECHDCGACLSVRKGCMDIQDPKLGHHQSCQHSAQQLRQQEADNSADSSNERSSPQESSTTDSDRDSDDTSSDAGLPPRASAHAIGLDSIIRGGMRNNSRHANSSFITNSSGAQSFVGSIQTALCDLCERQMRPHQRTSKCFYCMKNSHLECLATAMRMREPDDNNIFIDLHPCTTNDAFNDLGLLVVGTDTFNTDEPNNEGAINNDQYSIGNSDEIHSGTQLRRTTQENISQVHSTMDEGALLVGGNSNSDIVRQAVRSQLVNGGRNGHHMSCLDCRNAMNRKCKRCGYNLKDGPSLMRVSCGPCGAWFHSRCLRCGERVEVYHHVGEWMCDSCNPAPNYGSNGYNTP